MGVLTQDDLDAIAVAIGRRREPAPPPGGQLLEFTAQQPGLTFAGAMTVKGTVKLPPGTAAVQILCTNPFSAISVTGFVTGFTYVTLANSPSNGQLGTFPVASAIDDRLIVAVTSLASQQGTLFVVAFPNYLPQSSQLAAFGRAVLFKSQSRIAGTYALTIPLTNGARGLIAYLAVTAGGGTVTMTVQNSAGQTMAGDVTDGLLASGAIAVGNGANLYVYPGTKTVANFSDSFPIGQTPIIQAVVATAATTFEIDYDLIP